MSPRFIVLDGLDGTGKTTQCQLLSRWLQTRGVKVTTCADPGGTETGDLIRAALLSNRSRITIAAEAFLFMASRAQLVSEVVRPALERGEWVLSDRFLLANVVYQGHAGGLDVDLLWTMGDLATGGIHPNLSIVLDLPNHLALSRRLRPADRMESRDSNFHEKVRQGFLAEAKRNPKAIHVVDASPAIEQVQENLRRELNQFLV